MRFGLCCAFQSQAIKFRTTTATAMLRLSRADALTRLAEICRENAAALRAALAFCRDHAIGSFRVNSQILPLKTHPRAGYSMDELPGGADIILAFRACGRFARRHGLRTTFHPDQFVVLNSPRPEVLAASVAELQYQAEVAAWIGADVLNIHGGGLYGDRAAALARLARQIEFLPPAIRRRLTLENDEKLFTPADLLPVCRATGVPLVYDVHHHRLHGDGWSVAQATRRAVATWDREPLFHVSSPRDGWNGPQPARHHDYLDPADFPQAWLAMDVTVEIEAKAKEDAIFRLREQLV